MPVYLKLDKIRGLASAKGYEGWIELLSLYIKVKKLRLPDNPTDPLPPIEFECSHRVDGSSSALFHASQFPDLMGGQVDFVGARGAFLGFDIEEVMVTNYSFSSAGDQRAASFTLSIQRVTMTTAPRNGSVDDLPPEYDLSDLRPALGT